jgi:RHS repeat-associated protein
LGAVRLLGPGPQNRVAADSTYTYVYDAEGNLTERKFASGGATDQTYVWDHKNRLTKVENYAAGLVAETIDYRYDAAGGLVRRSVTPAGQTATVEHYAMEGGRRALALDAAGNVKQRYAYAPSGEVLVDQAFATTGAETQLTTPLADHQGSPRVLYGGASNTAPGVRQSVDYAPFGRITEVRDDAGAPTTAALDAAFGHHGSLQDQDTGLQLKGARWYSPGTGRFVSVDPIQDGTNWYAFAGNDPVNQSDPTGLKAIWSDPRNTLSAPSYKLQSTSFDTSLRTSVPRAPSSTQQIGLASTGYTPYSPPPAAPKVRFTAALSPTGQAVRDYHDWQDARRVANANAYELVDIAGRNRGAWEQVKLWDNDVVAQNATNLINTGSSIPGAVYGAAGTAIADNVGVSRLESARTAKDFYGKPLNGGEQFTELVMGGFQIGTTAVGLKTPVMRAAGGLRTVPPLQSGILNVADNGIDLSTYRIHGNPAVTWVDEAASMSVEARLYNSGAEGARSNVSTRLLQAPSIPRTVDGRVSAVRFDGESPGMLIDRKLAVVTSPKAQSQALRQSDALRQNSLRGMWEVPDTTQASRARNMFAKLGVDNIDVRVAPR